MVHWNSWFDGLIYAQNPSDYPVQPFLQNLMQTDLMSQITSLSDIGEIYELSNRTVRAAYVIVAMIPIVSSYPFLQRYFIKGIVV